MDARSVLHADNSEAEPDGEALEAERGRAEALVEGANAGIPAEARRETDVN